jgi:hypothetical protein
VERSNEARIPPKENPDLRAKSDRVGQTKEMGGQYISPDSKGYCSRESVARTIDLPAHDRRHK